MDLEKEIALPKVSVIIPAYNCQAWVQETLESIASQTYANWECVIVDDGSTDETFQIVSKYCSSDGRFSCYKQINSGPSVARNVAIHHSTGEFILPVDADDLIAPTFLEKAISRFIQHPDTSLVYGLVETFGEQCGLFHTPNYTYNDIIWGNSIIICSAMYRRIDYDKTNGYNPHMIHGYEDWDFWLSLLNKESVVYRIDEVMYYYRTHSVSRAVKSWEHISQLNRQIYHNHPYIYEPYLDEILNMHRRICELKANNEELRNEVAHLRNTRAFKLGKFLLLPFSWFKK